MKLALNDQKMMKKLYFETLVVKKFVPFIMAKCDFRSANRLIWSSESRSDGQMQKVGADLLAVAMSDYFRYSSFGHDKAVEVLIAVVLGCLASGEMMSVKFRFADFG